MWFGHSISVIWSHTVTLRNGLVLLVNGRKTQRLIMGAALVSVLISFHSSKSLLSIQISCDIDLVDIKCLLDPSARDDTCSSFFHNIFFIFFRINRFFSDVQVHCAMCSNLSLTSHCVWRRSENNLPLKDVRDPDTWSLCVPWADSNFKLPLSAKVYKARKTFKEVEVFVIGFVAFWQLLILL